MSNKKLKLFNNLIKTKKCPICQKKDIGEFIVHFSQNKKPYGEKGFDAVTFRVGGKKKDTLHSHWRSKVFDEYLTTNSYWIDPEKKQALINAEEDETINLDHSKEIIDYWNRLGKNK